MKNISIALFQLNSKLDSLNQKLEIEEYLNQVASNTAIILLPEMFLQGPYKAFENIENENESLNFLIKMAKKYKKIIIGSALTQVNSNNRNRAYVVYPNGNYAFYDKKKMFGKEKGLLKEGDKHLIIQVNGWKILILLCYDLRFPEWSRMNKQEYDAIIYLAQWPDKRIDAWNTLLKARAIENLSYVIGVNGSGGDYPGKSQVVDPEGNKILDLENDITWKEITLKFKNLIRIREDLPFLKDRDNFVLLNQNFSDREE